MRSVWGLGLVVLAACPPEDRRNAIRGETWTTDFGVDSYPEVHECDYDDNGVPTLCRLSGVITGDDVVLTNDRLWLLRGGVFVGAPDESPATLTIEPGTTILGDTVTRGFLVVRRHSTITAIGTPTAPIVFTSSAAPGSRQRSDWGGLVINGDAPINTCNGTNGGDCEAIGEGGSGRYGGTDPNDSSGVLQYVRVEFGGFPVTPDDELNGIAFQGVGAGTVVDHVQVHMGGDDGVEFFGGTVNVKHLVLTGLLDDAFDWTFGWSGKAQFVVAQQHDDAGNNGVEGDNNNTTSPTQNDFVPRSRPTLSNFTLIGSGSAALTRPNSGALLREGTAGELHSFVIAGWDNLADSACLQLNQLATVNQATSGDLSIASSLVDCHLNFRDGAGGPVPKGTASAWFTGGPGNVVAAPLLVDAFDLDAPVFTPDAGSPAASGGTVPADAFFTPAPYRGVVDPANDWVAQGITDGWISLARH